MLLMKEKLRSYDTDIVFVSLGAVDEAKDFLDKYPHLKNEEIYISTDIVKGDAINGAAGAYAMMKLVRGMEAVIGGNFKNSAAQAAADGYVDLPNLGGSSLEYPSDTTQLGGVFILGPGNFCEYSYRSAYGGDHADNEEILKYAKQSKKDYARKFSNHASERKGSDDDSSVSSTSSDDNGNDGEVSRKRAFTHPATEAWVGKLNMSQKVPEATAAVKPSAPLFSLDVSGLVDIKVALPLVAGAIYVVKSAHLVPNSILVGVVSGLLVIFIGHYFMNNITKRNDSDNVATEPSGKTTLVSETLIGKTATAPRPSASGGDVRLFTPAEIDQLMLEAGQIDCDCPSMVMDIPVTGRMIDVLPSPVSRMRAPSRVDDEDIVALTNTELVASAQMLCFLREFLSKPHPLLGRKGPVCPFIPTALRKNSIYMALVRTGPTVTPDDIKKIVEPIASRFETLEPTEGIMTSYKAVLMVFPDIDLSQARTLIDGVQEMLKPQFVQKGLMIGEFHKNNNASGLRNPDFYPLRTPVPTLAVRHMVTGDIAFLDMSKYAPDIRVSFLTNYIGRFKDDDAPRTVEMLERAREELEKARTELKLAA